MTPLPTSKSADVGRYRPRDTTVIDSQVTCGFGTGEDDSCDLFCFFPAEQKKARAGGENVTLKL